MSQQDFENLIFCLPSALLHRELRLNPYGINGELLQAAADLVAAHAFFHHESREELGELISRLSRSISRLRKFPPDSEREEIMEYLAESVCHLRSLHDEPDVERTAWRASMLSDQASSVPTMLHGDTRQYYRWLGTRLSGCGEAVELGSWIGSSTCCIAEGMGQNPSLEGRRLHAFDSFRWEQWMNPYVDDAFRAAYGLQPGVSYLDAFREACAPYQSRVVPTVAYVYSPGESGELPMIRWDGAPIELFVYDMGPQYAQVESAWNVFRPSFVPGRTMVVFNEYGSPRAESLRRFCRERAAELVPMHKPWGPAKAFLLRASVA